MQWIVFSDLHVTARSLPVALDVLAAVHAEAVARHAGILFLGDFWTERGRLPTAPLNAVIQAVAAWTQPAWFLPGNHDQVDLGGDVHGIAPLAAANAKIRCIDEPTVASRLLLIPYRRRTAEVLEAIAAHDGQYDAIACHIDVVGAYMNDAIQAGIGLFPHELPACPIYTGHYHKPHSVKDAANIVYVGSPYQISHHEAGQAKRFLVLDDERAWSVVDEIAVDLGPRHYEATVVDDALKVEAFAPRPGDRVVVRADRPEARWPATAIEQVAGWRDADVTVDVHVAPESAVQRIEHADRLPPHEVWRLYGDVVALDPVVARAGVDAITAAAPAVRCAADATNVEFVAVTAAGYGPFVDEVVYPLALRGAVLVTGENRDMPGSESNGAGKTSLVMAALWALTGESDPRPDGASPKALGKEMVNHACDNATVRLDLRVNAAQVVVERAHGKSGHKLRLWRDGVEVTQQDVDLTQAALDALIDTSRVARTIFFGQHETASFLDATDKGAKDQISAVVPVDVYEAARVEAQARRKVAETAANQAEFAVHAAVTRLDGANAAIAQAKRRQDEFEAARGHALAALDIEHTSILADEAVWQDRQNNNIAQRASELAALAARESAWLADRDRRVLAAQAAADSILADAHEWTRHRDRKLAGLRQDQERTLASAVEWDDAQQHRVAQLVASAVKLHAACTTEAASAARARLDAARGAQAAIEARPAPNTAAVARQAEQAARMVLAHAQAAQAGVVAEGKALRAARDRFAALTGRCDACEQQIDGHVHATMLARKDVEVGAVRARYATATKAVTDADAAVARAAVAVAQAEQADRVEQVAARSDLQRAMQEVATATAAVSALQDAAAQAAAEDARLRDARAATNPYTGMAAAMQREIEAIEATCAPHAGQHAAAQAEVGRIAAEPSPIPAERARLEAACATLRAEQWAGRGRYDALAARRAAKQAEPNPYLASQTDAERDVQQAHADVAATTKARDAAQFDASVWKDADTHLGRTGVQNFVLEAAVADLQTRVQRYLDELSDGYLFVQISSTTRNAKGGTSERLDRKIHVRRADGDYAEFRLRQLSGGQRRRVLIATTLAFAEFCAARTGLRSDLVVFDEVFQHLDAAGRAKINAMVRQLAYKTILVISHDTDLASQFDRVDTVVLERDTATIQVG